MANSEPNELTTDIIVASIYVHSGKYAGHGGCTLVGERSAGRVQPIFLVQLDYPDPPVVTIDGRPADRAAVIEWVSRTEEPRALVTQDFNRYGHVIRVSFSS